VSELRSIPTCVREAVHPAVTGSPFRKYWSGSQAVHPNNKSSQTIPTSNDAEFDRLVDRHHPLPDAAPHEIIRSLMEHRGLKQGDLVALIGSRAQVSDMVTGKRSVSKTQARKLAPFFQVSPALFL
jgi:hypothetical protein